MKESKTKTPLKIAVKGAGLLSDLLKKKEGEILANSNNAESIKRGLVARLESLNLPTDSVKILDNGMVDYSDDLIEPLNKAGMGDVRKEIGDYNSIIDPDYRLNIPDSTQYRGLPEPYDESKTPHLSWTSDNPEYASAYSYGGADKTNTGKGANVTPMSVDVKNPFDFGFRSQFAEVKYGDMLDRLRRGVGDAFKAKKISRDEGLDLIDEIEDLRDSIDNPNEFRPVYSWWNNKPEMVEILKKSKFDGLNAREGIDDNISTVAAFGKNQLRSKLGAALDPAKKNSGNILAGIGGLGVLGGSLASEDAEAGTLSQAAKGLVKLIDDGKGSADIVFDGVPAGSIKYDVNGDSVQIYSSNIEPQNKGIGSEAYRQFIDSKIAEGKSVGSDAIVSEKAQGLYRKLGGGDYNVSENPNTRLLPRGKKTSLNRDQIKEQRDAAGTYFDADAGVITNNPVRYKGEPVFNISKKGAATPEALGSLALTSSGAGLLSSILNSKMSEKQKNQALADMKENTIENINRKSKKEAFNNIADNLDERYQRSGLGFETYMIPVVGNAPGFFRAAAELQDNNSFPEYMKQGASVLSLGESKEGAKSFLNSVSDTFSELGDSARSLYNTTYMTSRYK